MSRRLATAAAVLLSGCTAQWDSLVRYSPTPAGPGPLDAQVIQAIAGEYRDEWHFDTVYLRLPTDGDTAVRAVMGPGGTAEPPKYWSDSLRKATRAALEGARRQGMPDRQELLGVLASVGLHPMICDSATCPLPHLLIGHPGYNADSTIAAVEVWMVCGGLCGHGRIAMLARRPGHAWREWWSFLSWVS